MAAAKTRIAVIGTVNVDTVTRPNGSITNSYGGMLYNLIPLSQITHQLLGDAVEIWPVVRIGSDHAEAILEKLKELPGIMPGAIKVVDRPNNHCHLTYHDDSHKSEVLRGWVGAVTKTQVSRVLDFDTILVNFISGGDISSKTLQWLREKSTATIFIDFHSHSLGRRRDGSRFLRRPRDWREVVRCADYLQMNEIEFEVLAGEPVSRDSLRRFAAAISLDTNQELVVTRGGNPGLRIRRRRVEDGRISIDEIVTPAAKRIKDPTGCGDIFSAVFIALRAAGEAVHAAFRCASAVATKRAESTRSLENIDFRRFFHEDTYSRRAQNRSG